MAKSSGLGDNFYVGGYDLSGDIASLDKLSGSMTPIDVTPINTSAHVRIGGLRSGDMAFTAYMDTAASHIILSSLPRTDVISTYFRGVTIGNPAASMTGKEVSYDPTRTNTGQLTMKVDMQSNSFGLEWGQQLTNGIFSATNFLTGQNAGFEGGIGTWAAGANNPTLADTAAQAHTGSNSMSMTSSTSGNMAALNHTDSGGGFPGTGPMAVVPGNQVYAQAWFRSAVSARTCLVLINWYTSGGTYITSSNSGNVTDSTSAWTMNNLTATAPATAAFALVVVQVNGTGGASEVHYVDDVEFMLLPTSLDTLASASFGGQAYLQVFSFTGTDATVKIQDSADNTTFADVTSFAFSQITSSTPQAQRISISNTSTIRRYVAATVISTGGFSALSFAVQLTKNNLAGQVY